MGEKDQFKQIIYGGIILALFVLVFLLLKPLILVIVFALILAFVAQPIYKKLSKYLKSKNISALIICILLILLIILPIWFLSPILVEQSFQIYKQAQGTDFSQPLKQILPSTPAAESLAQKMGDSIHSFVTDLANSTLNLFSDMISNFPAIVLKTLVLFFTFFVALKNQEPIIKYIKSVLPFNESVKKKLFKASRGVTSSVIYGQVILGIIEGLLVGAALFIFDVNNALLLTIIASIAGIFPIIGTAIVWIPIAILTLITGNYFAALGVTIAGVLASIVEGFVKPIFISRRVSMHSALVLLGMVGGLLLFGLIGVILGPLILAYLFIILEIYRDRGRKKEKAPKALQPQ